MLSNYRILYILLRVECTTGPQTYTVTVVLVIFRSLNHLRRSIPDPNVPREFPTPTWHATWCQASERLQSVDHQHDWVCYMLTGLGGERN
jgi:hypothetical protein